MGPRKNIFRIGRKGHDDDEDQLTEMFAYLLQEESRLVPEWLASLGLGVDGLQGWQIETQRSIPAGFLDLVLFVPGEALVVVESKIGSTTDFAQITKYITYARSVSAPRLRALVFTTKHPEPWPTGVAEYAGDDVALVLRRWQAVSDFLADSDSALGKDFVAMLEEEGIVTPNAFTAHDWETWHLGNRVSRDLATLLQETGAAITNCAANPIKPLPVTYASGGQIHRGFDFEDLSLYVGFWPTRKLINPGEFALVAVYVLNKTLLPSERKAAAQAAVEKAVSSNVAIAPWPGFLVRTTSAHDVLTATDFREQCDQLVEHVRRDIQFFAELGYLSNATLPSASDDAQEGIGRLREHMETIHFDRPATPEEIDAERLSVPEDDPESGVGPRDEATY